MCLCVPKNQVKFLKMVIYNSPKYLIINQLKLKLYEGFTEKI